MPKIRNLVAVFLFFISIHSMGVVGIVQTPMKNQFNGEICWSYAGVAYIEQLALKNGLGPVDLSEEHLGFYHLVHQIRNGFHEIIYKGGEVSDVLFYAELYGVVPEVVFNYKHLVSDDLNLKLKANVLDYKKKKGLPLDAKISLEEAVALVEQTYSIKLPRPDSFFEFRGKKYTSRSFSSDYLRVSKNDSYLMMIVNPESEPEKFRLQMKMIQKALSYGYTVPLSIPTFSTSYSSSGLLCENCGELKAEDAEGGHILLLSDYKTKSVPFGPVETSAVELAYSEVPERWAVKNSWGFYKSNTKAPLDNLRSPRGLHAWTVLGSSYLRTASRIAIPCPECDFSEPLQSLKLPTYLNTSANQPYVLLPKCIYDLDSLIESPLKGQSIVESRFDFDRKEIVTQEKQVKGYLGSTINSPSNVAILTDSERNEPMLKQVEFSGKKYGQQIETNWTQSFLLQKEEAKFLGLQFLILNPAVKSVAIFRRVNVAPEIQDGSFANERQASPSSEFYMEIPVNKGQVAWVAKIKNIGFTDLILQPLNALGEFIGPAQEIKIEAKEDTSLPTRQCVKFYKM